MATKLINVSRVPQQVGVIVDGVRTSIRLMPRNKGVELDEDTTIDYSWLALNPGVVRVVAETTNLIPKAPVEAVVEDKNTDKE